MSGTTLEPAPRQNALRRFEIEEASLLRPARLRRNQRQAKLHGDIGIRFAPQPPQQFPRQEHERRPPSPMNAAVAAPAKSNEKPHLVYSRFPVMYQQRLDIGFTADPACATIAQ